MMVLELSVVIPGVPMAVQSVKSRNMGKFIGHYQPAKVINWKSYVAAFVADNLPDGWIPLDGGIRAEYLFVFPILKSMKKATRHRILAGEVIYKITKPDLGDNLKKGLNDALSGIVWTDDCRIASDRSIKIYGEVPRIEIRVFSGLTTE